MKPKSLEGKTAIFNPGGANKQATKELIKSLSETAKDKFAGDYARDIIGRVKKGYEIQSGQKYEE